MAALSSVLLWFYAPQRAHAMSRSLHYEPAFKKRSPGPGARVARGKSAGRALAASRTAGGYSQPGMVRPGASARAAPALTRGKPHFRQTPWSVAKNEPFVQSARIRLVLGFYPSVRDTAESNPEDTLPYLLPAREPQRRPSSPCKITMSMRSERLAGASTLPLPLTSKNRDCANRRQMSLHQVPWAPGKRYLSAEPWLQASGPGRSPEHRPGAFTPPES
jgi:hypothetical protein